MPDDQILWSLPSAQFKKYFLKSGLNKFRERLSPLLSIEQSESHQLPIMKSMNQQEKS